MTNPTLPTRADLESFLPNHRLIRAFEQLFGAGPADTAALTILIEEVGIEAVSAAAAANKNSAALQRIAEALELLTSAPVAPELQRIDAAALDMLLTAPPYPVTHTAYGHARYSSAIDQTSAVINTAYAVTFDTAQNESGVSLVSSSRVTVASAGVYEVTVGAQALLSVAASHTIDLWLRKNGVDIIDTRLAFTVTANGDTKHIGNTYQVSMAVGDYIEAAWASSTTSMSLDATVAPAYGPTSPSASLSIKQLEVT